MDEKTEIIEQFKAWKERVKKDRPKEDVWDLKYSESLLAIKYMGASPGLDAAIDALWAMYLYGFKRGRSYQRKKMQRSSR